MKIKEKKRLFVKLVAKKTKMKAKCRHSGLTLMELTVVIAGAVIVGAISLPAVRALRDSFNSAGAAKTIISSALTSARAIAAKEQRYAGIRFQKEGYHGDLPSPGENDAAGLINASQYIIFIVHDRDKTGLANGFRAVEGIEPIKLPDSIGVMDLRRRTNWGDSTNSGYEDVGLDNDIDEVREVRDTTTFSIVFSPAGKLVIHDVRVSNRDGIRRPHNDSSWGYDISWDDIFNSPKNIQEYKTGMFIQDDYAGLGLGQEPSRRSFVIYEKDKFKTSFEIERAYSQYLSYLKGIYINPYTGRMIRQ